MARWFRLRDLFLRFPALDGLRLSILAWICDHGTSFFDRSYNIVRVAAPGAREFVSADGSGKPAIFALYHGRMVGLLGLKPRKRLTILISQSRDGEIIARACVGLGFSIARGSAARGGVHGASELVKASKAGQNLAFTVDGPRGPIYEVKSGIIRLAELTGLPIVPFVCRARGADWMKSWDRFMAPKWGTPILYLFGDPLQVPPGADNQARDELRFKLERRMKALRETADQFFA